MNFARLAGMAVVSFVGCAAVSTATKADVVRSGSGANAAAIQGVVDQYRADLGTLNPNVAGSFGSGRREINWDGVPDALSAPNNLPNNFFNVNSPRGVVFSTPGSAVQVSGNAGVAPVRFDNINPNYSSIFSTFSAQRLFTSIGSNITDVNFFVPGSTTPALTRGFGAVFTDVDLAGSTVIQFFGIGNNLLRSDVVPNFSAAGAGNTSGSFSFLGVSFDNAVVSRVRITSGNSALGAGINDGSGVDLVVMDDFIYGEPLAVPIPAAFLLFGSGLATLLGFGRARRRS